MEQAVEDASQGEALAAPSERWDIRRAMDEGLCRLFQADSSKAYWLAFSALAVAALTASAALFASGCSPIFEMPHDGMLSLDGAWRIFCGQRPHTDFYSAIGIVPFLITGLGMLIVGPSADALAVGPAALLPLIAAWSWLIARRRLSAMHALAVAAFISFLTVGQFALGYEFRACSYAMQYNRYAWSFLCLLLLEAFIAPLSRPKPRGLFLEGASTGALLGLLAFTKITYFGLAALAIAFALARRGREGRRLGGILAGFLLVVLASAAFLNFDLHAYAADILMLGRGAKLHEQLSMITVRGIASALWGLYLLVFALLVWQPGPLVRFRAERYSGLLAAVVIVGLGLVILATNSQPSQMPVLVIAAYALFEPAHHAQLSSQVLNRSRGNLRLRFSTGSVLLLFAIAPFFCADAGSIAYACLWNRIKGPRMGPAARFQSKSLASMILPPHTIGSGKVAPNPNVEELNDGLTLLHAHADASAKVLCFAFENPFSFADLRPCPHGGALCWDYPRLVNERSYPPPDAVFIDADVIMVPHARGSRCTTFMLEHYGSILEARYELRARSRYWALYRAKTHGVGQGAQTP